MQQHFLSQYILFSWRKTVKQIKILNHYFIKLFFKVYQFLQFLHIIDFLS